ncbi:hypothetical protein P7M17_07980 [Vibrio parahaemolyticus]|nr:hypothetical protein [Vibrio parahaemolyticus]
MKSVFINGSKIPACMVKAAIVNSSVVHEIDAIVHESVSIKPPHLQIHFGDSGSNSFGSAQGVIGVLSGQRSAVSVPVMNIYGYQVLAVIDELASAGFYTKEQHEQLTASVSKDLNKTQKIFDALLGKGYGIESYLNFKPDFANYEIKFSNAKKVIEQYQRNLELVDFEPASITFKDGKVCLVNS